MARSPLGKYGVRLTWPLLLGFAGAASLLPAPALAEPAEAPAGDGEELTGKEGVVAPTLVHFEPAPYPDQALAQGLEAEVLLRLVINEQGTVDEVEVVQGAGHGFDEAAAAAAKSFVFTPATVNGVPTAVAIQYQYRFEAPLVETPPDKVAAPALGNLEGNLLVAGPDVPLAGARVTATAADGVVYEVYTDEKGSWLFADLPPGKYVVGVEAEGFVTIQLTEEVVAGEATGVTYRVSPQSEGIEIVVQGERPPREVTRRTLQRREISRIPGTGGDALRSIQSLPGVARPPGLAGLLIVRGSAPNDTNTFMDGALVPLIYHFGGLSSVVPTELVERIDFYPGNFSAKYGRVMGGVVDVGLASPNAGCTDDYGKEIEDAARRDERCFHGLAQVDLIDGRVLFQGPIGKDWSFAVGGRRSWVDTWLKPVLEEAGAGVTTAPVYYDYQAIAETKPSKTSRLRLQLYGSSDALEILINNPAAQEPGFGGTLSFSTEFYRLQAIYEQQLSEDWSLYSTMAVGNDTIDFRIGQAFFRLDADGIQLRSELGYRAFQGLKINGGIDFLVAPVDVIVRAPEPPRPGEPADTPFSTKPLLESEVYTEGFRPAWYMDAEVQPTDRLLLVPGVRLDYARDSGHADTAPRLTARYTLIGLDSDVNEEGERPLRTTLKGGVGVFYQPPEYQETDPVFGQPGLESNRSLHYSLGVEQELSKQIDVSVEGYYKDLDNLVSRSPSADGSFQYSNAGTGATMGTETLIKYNPDDRFFGWFAYTLARSVRRNNPDEPEYLFQFDQTHNLTALGSYRLGRGWEVGARFRLVSGNMTTPVRRFPDLQAIQDTDTGAYVPLQGEQFSDRLPLFHQLDVRVEKNWQFRDWRLMAYLDVWNAYNNAAVEDVNYNFNFSQSAYQTGLPIIPSLGVRGEF